MRLHVRNIIKQSHSIFQAQLKNQSFDEKIAHDETRTHASRLHDERAPDCATWAGSRKRVKQGCHLTECNSFKLKRLCINSISLDNTGVIIQRGFTVASHLFGRIVMLTPLLRSTYYNYVRTSNAASLTQYIFE